MISNVFDFVQAFPVIYYTDIRGEQRITIKSVTSLKEEDNDGLPYYYFTLVDGDVRFLQGEIYFHPVSNEVTRVAINGYVAEKPKSASYWTIDTTKQTVEMADLPF